MALVLAIGEDQKMENTLRRQILAYGGRSVSSLLNQIDGHKMRAHTWETQDKKQLAGASLPPVE